MKRIVLSLIASATMWGQLQPADPATVGMSAERLERAGNLLAAEVAKGDVLSASILVARKEKIVLHKGWGKLHPRAGAQATQPDTVYLLASISKPINAAGLMLLVEEGKVLLDEPASRYLPELKGGNRELIRVRDLLSHTSGLPDMLPENTELRRAHAPLSEFVRHTFTTPLLYKPGTSFRYQSKGTLLAGEIVERVSGMRLRDFLAQRLFAPLGMKDTALGLGGKRIEDSAWCQTSGGNQADQDRFGANSPYWRDMGHPWGGVHSTTSDLAHLLQALLNGGTYAGKTVFAKTTVDEMIRDQNTKIQAPWGLGWGLRDSLVWCYFGELGSPRTFGHSGATGTVAWADPENDLLAVILTTRPSGMDGGRLLRSVSNAVAASVVR